MVWQGPEVDLSVDSAAQSGEDLTLAELRQVAYCTLKDLTSDQFDFMNDFSNDEEELVESD